MRIASPVICRLKVFVFLVSLNASLGLAQQLTVEEKGLPANGVFHVGGTDDINLQNGNLHVNIPLYVSKQRGGRVLTWNLVYNTPTWTRVWIPDPSNCPLQIEGYLVSLDDRAVRQPDYQYCGSRGWYSVIPTGTFSTNWRYGTPFATTIYYKDVTDLCPIPVRGENSQSYHGMARKMDVAVIDQQGTSHLTPLQLEHFQSEDIETGQVSNNSCFGTHLSGPTLDGSGLFASVVANDTFNIDSFVVKERDGTKNEGFKITDANGNVLDGLNDTSLQGLLTVDNFPTHDSSDPLAPRRTYSLYHYKDSDGNDQSIRVDYIWVTWTSNLCSAPQPFDIGSRDCYEASDEQEAISKVTLPNGKTYEFSYQDGSPGNLTKITLPTGGTLSYEYTTLYELHVSHGIPNLASSSQAVSKRTASSAGRSDEWLYSIPHLGLTTVTEPDGSTHAHTFSKVYTNDITSASRESTGRYETNVEYRSSAGTVVRTVSSSYQADFNFRLNATVNVRKTGVSITYEDGSVTRTETDYDSGSYTDPGPAGSETKFTRLNPTEVREYGYGSGQAGPLMRRTTFQYLHDGDANYAAQNIIDKPIDVAVYDGSGVLVGETRYEYDNYKTDRMEMKQSGAPAHDASYGSAYLTRGNRTAVMRWDSANDAFVTERSQFDDAGNAIGVMDALGNKSVISYEDKWDNTGCAASFNSQAYPTKVTNPLQQSVSATYYSCSGLVASSTDANQKTTTAKYDSLGRMLSAEHPDGGAKSFCYSDDVNGSCPTKVWTTTETTNLDASRHIVRTSSWDGFGYLSQTSTTSDPLGTVYQDFAQRSDGRQLSESNPYRGAASGVPTTYHYYDPLGRENRTVKPGGFAVLKDVSGAVTTVTDEALNVWKSTQDVFGNVTGVEEPNDAATRGSVASYAYDALGHLTSIKQKGKADDPVRARSFHFSSLGRLLTATNSETATICYGLWNNDPSGGSNCVNGYDANGNLLAKTDARGVTTSYTYDKLNRLTSKSYSDGTRTVYYGYDGKDVNGGDLSAPWNGNAVGRLTIASDKTNVSTLYAYDAMGRLSAKKDFLPSARRFDDAGASAGYDLAGNMTSFTYPDGRVVQTGYDAAGRMSGVSYAQWGSTPKTRSYFDASLPSDYDAAGHLVGGAFGNGVGMAAAYDTRQRIGTLAYGLPGHADFLWSRNYTWTPNSNLDHWTDLANNNTRQFGYDSLNRLTSAVDSVTTMPTPTSSPGGSSGTGTIPATLPPPTTFYPNVNLLQGDNTSANPGWNLRDSGVSWNSASAPDGSNTAATIQMHASECNMCMVNFVSNAGELNGQIVTGSVYLRTDGPAFSTKLYLPNTSNGSTYFPVSPITVTSAWQRYSLTTQLTGSQSMLALQIGGDRGIPDGQTLQVWGAQLIQGSNATSYAPNLLSGDQLTGNPGWGYSGASPAWNGATAPDGTATAAVFTATNGNGNVYDIVPDPGQYSGQTVTGSVWLKSPNGTSSAWLNLPLANGDGYAQSGKTVTVTNTWQCFSYTQQLPGGLSLLALQIGGASTFANGQVLQVWEPQLLPGKASSCPASPAGSSSSTQVTVRFTNDSCSACSGQAPNQDRNLYVQSVSVGGQSLGSGDPQWNYRGVYYQPNGGVLGAGDFYTTFNATGPVSITAYGTPDYGVYPHMQLLVNGSLVKEWDVTGQPAIYTYTPATGGSGGSGGGGTGSGGGSVGTGGMNLAYEYDSFGNLKKYGSVSADYNANNQNTNLSYDAAGNLQYTNFGQQILWDAESRISAVAGVQYVYDGEGNRVSTSNGTDTVYFGGRPVARYNNGQWTDLIYGPQGLVAEVAGTENAEPQYRLTDHLGTLAGTTDHNQTLLNATDYTPFGQVFSGGNNDPYFFTGKERDSESGLDYFGARYYASSMGRWMSPDWSPKEEPVPYAKLDDPQSLNLYSYVRNNPLSRVDADGHCSAPSVGKGQVGICIDLYIQSQTVPKAVPLGLGFGDGRGPAANDPSASYRVEMQFVVNTATKDVSLVKNDAGTSTAVIGPVVLDRKGGSVTDVTKPTVDENGTEHFSVNNTAINGLSSLPLAPKDTIKTTMNISVTADGKVGLDPGGSRTAYPSIEMYSYRSDGTGSTIYQRQESGNLSDLQHQNQSIPAVQPH